MTPEAFVDQLRAEVPEAGALVDAHLDEYDELLLHLLVADLRRVLTQAFRDGNVDLVRRGLDVLERALVTGEAGVVNAIAVSFVEGSGGVDPGTQTFIDAWPAALRAEMERQRSWETTGSDDAGKL